MNCPYCGQETNVESAAKVKAARSTRIKLGQAHSAKKPGRPRFINPQAVLMMRKNGKSIREIARTLCCSPAAVHKVLKNEQHRSSPEIS